jgi:hypothetical protein
MAQQSCSKLSMTARESSANPFVLNSKHGNFKEAESKRPDFDSQAPITVSKVPDPDWKYGGGANDKSGFGKKVT